ncbi:hypothetical protein H1C71_028018 [Ictidomys tridecemlineatus]|nr:hypothetical protein H1C71_028018 [Ictidomys tridecemlineatus]
MDDLMAAGTVPAEAATGDVAPLGGGGRGSARRRAAARGVKVPRRRMDTWKLGHALDGGAAQTRALRERSVPAPGTAPGLGHGDPTVLEGERSPREDEGWKVSGLGRLVSFYQREKG